MRVCDRCKIPEKKSANTYRDKNGGEIELCEGCVNAFITFLDNPDKPAQEKTTTPQGRTAKK